MSTEEKLIFAQALIREAGAQLRSRSRNELKIHLKNHDVGDLVSDADKQTEKLLVSAIRKRFKGQSFLTEEKWVSYKPKTQTWIIDPIDGTTNFVTWKRDYTISIAYYEEERPVFGLVYDVEADDLYLGITGGGAWKHGERLAKLPQDKPLSRCVADVSLKSIALLKSKYGIQLDKLASHIRGHRSSGCASLCLCRLAAGELDVYLSAHLKTWDYAAAAILINETGGAWGLPFHDRQALYSTSVPFLAAGSRNLYPPIVNKFLTVNRI